MLVHEKIHQYFYKWQRNLLIGVGHDIYEPVFKVNAWTYFVYFSFALFFFSCFYTIASLDLFKILNSVALLCLAMEVSV